MRRIVLILPFLFSFLYGNSQDVTVVNIGLEKGLLSSEIHDIDQDLNGFMWFASGIGIFRYDGSEFKFYSSKNGLTHSEVFDIFIDVSNRIWLNTYKGGICYFENDSIKEYQYNHILKEFIDSVGLYDTHIDEFFYEKNQLYFALTKSPGIYKIDAKGEVESIELESSNAKIFYRKIFRGNISGLINDEIEININSGVIDTSFNYYDFAGNHNHKSKVLVDNKTVVIGRKLFANENSLLVQRRVLEHTILSLKVDIDGHLWVGTKNGGLLFIENNQINKTPLKKYLAGLSITDIYQDQQNNIWVSTLEKGIFLINNPNTLSYKLANWSISSKISKLQANENAILFGTVDGSVYTIKNDSIKKVYRRQITSDIKDILILNNKDALTNGVKVDYTTLNNSHHPESIYSEMKIFTSNDDLISCGYFGFRVIRNDSIIYNSRDFSHPINEEKIKDMCYLNDTLWILTTTNIYNYYSNKLYKKEFPVLNIPELKELGQFNDSLLVLCSKNDGVYLKSEQNLWNHISTNEGLNSCVCYSLLCSEKFIYVGTNNGLNVIRFEDGNYKIEYIDKTNYLNSNMIFDISLYKENLLLASEKGIDVISDYTSSIEFNPTFIYPLIVNGQEYFSIDNFYDFPFSKNDIKINYITPFYGENHQIRYRYKLNISDTLWKETDNTSIEFPNLNPGEYHFIVQPYYNSTFGQKKYIDITIHPFFTNTWWFRTILFITLMAILYAVYRNKLAKKELEKDMILSKQKALVAQMNPHFIFNSLNSIQNFILKNQQDLSVLYLSRFSKLIRRILDNSDKLVVSIDDDIETLTHYIELEKARFKNKFEYSIYVDPSIDVNSYCIPPLLLQPFVENSIWHGLMHKKTKGEIQISFSKDKDRLVCVVEDNGVGRKKAVEFRKEKTYSSKGIKITKERIVLLSRTNNFDIKFNVIDLVDEENISSGTKVQFYLPLISNY